MSNNYRIGLLFADSMEFEPFCVFANQHGGEVKKVYGFNSISITLKNGGNEAQLFALECGIGKVCAASATAVLINCMKVDMLFIAGLSGAVSGCIRGDIIAGSACCECDMDLTPIGYAPGEKPGFPVMYEADEKLLGYAESLGIKKCVLGTGDIFLTDRAKKHSFRDTYGISSFDMESAAAASVCHRYGTPMLSIRKISDDADDSAPSDYREMNDLAQSSLTDILSRLIDKILSE